MKAEPNYEESLNLLSGEYTVQEDPVFYTQRTKGLKWAVTGITSSIIAIIANFFLIISGVLLLVGKSEPSFELTATSLTRTCWFVIGGSLILTVFGIISKRIAKTGDISGDLTSIVRGLAKAALISLIVGIVLFLTGLVVYNWAAVTNAFNSLFANMKALFNL